MAKPPLNPSGIRGQPKKRKRESQLGTERDAQSKERGCVVMGWMSHRDAIMNTDLCRTAIN